MAEANPASFHAKIMKAPSWRVVGDFGEISQDDYNRICAENKRSRGLGDLVASVTQPIARAIDAVAGTNIQNCGGCKQRQEALNKLVPRL